MTLPLALNEKPDELHNFRKITITAFMLLFVAGIYRARLKAGIGMCSISQPRRKRNLPVGTDWHCRVE
jgi:hypothetical protein